MSSATEDMFLAVCTKLQRTSCVHGGLTASARCHQCTVETAVYLLSRGIHREMTNAAPQEISAEASSRADGEAGKAKKPGATASTQCQTGEAETPCGAAPTLVFLDERQHTKFEAIAWPWGVSISVCDHRDGMIFCLSGDQPFELSGWLLDRIRL